MPGFGKKKVRIRTVGELRKSKLVNTAGCGSLVEFPGYSGMMGGLNLWDPRFKSEMMIHEKKLERMLRVQFFIQPVSEKNKTLYSHEYQIPVVRFPEYYYCPKCKSLDYANRIAENLSDHSDSVSVLKCNRCHEDLLPSRFVMACLDGHIEDFPYIWWAHKKAGTTCSHPRLKLSYIGKTGGLESMIVECENCGASNSLAGCLSEQALSGLKCSGRRPWLGHGNQCSCGKPLRALMKSSNNVYYPLTISALTIPPWSSGIQKRIEQDDSFFRNLFEIEDDELIAKGVSSFYKKHNIKEEFNCKIDDFIREVKARYNDTESSERITSASIMHEEYLALTGPDKNDIYFKTETTSVSPELRQLIRSVKLVKRLREVQVLYGFRRIIPIGEEAGSISPLSSDIKNWLPAVELLGEGIFIDFSRLEILEWMRDNADRYEKMKARYVKKDLQTTYGSFSPVYVLIHTVSHLLIRELSQFCGYDESSLRERIYVSATDEDGEWMCGLLIYTAVSSSDGSLGGLVRLGTQKTFSTIFHSMLRKARWCSNDPVCIESEAQGLDSLNYAACHACALIPEISCERNNILLDRGALERYLDTF